MMCPKIWIGLVFVFLLPLGCIDISSTPERECLADRRCGPSAEPVCGADGNEYPCQAQALCEGVQIDTSGEACQTTQTQCEPVSCELYCENGFDTDEDGCEICRCRESGPCPAAPCDLDCRYGYETDQNGCQLCECREEPTCPGVACDLFCEHGFETDENGCEICECREGEQACGGDSCVASYCGTRTARCQRESDLATMGACPDSGYEFYEPPPECLCAGDGCEKRGCFDDSECADGDLCAHSIGQRGYCVKASCRDLVTTFDAIATRGTDCTRDSDCAEYFPAHECCISVLVNTDAKTELEALEQFAAKTSCARQWDEHCAVVDCAPPEPGTVVCVQGTCDIER